MVRVVNLLLLFTYLTYGAEIYYCVQLSSSKGLTGMDRLLKRVEDLPDPRIEFIKGFYTLRVGYFVDVKEARNTLKEVKSRGFKDAFLRRCAYKPERVVTESHGRGEMDELETLKLITEALIGAGKLDKALQVAEEGIRRYPKNPYWWEVYTKLLLWTGRSSEALNAMLEAYKLSKKEQLLRQAFHLALSLRRFDIARKLIDKVEATEKEKEIVYRESGDIEGLIRLLKGRNDRKSLYALAEILFFLGRKEEALRVLDRIEERFGYSAKEALLKANILYTQKRYREALEVLKKHAKNIPPDEEDYWATLSDLSWMLADYETAKLASLKLIELNKGRAVDYYRAVDLLSKEEPKRAIHLALEAYEKFKLNPFLEKAVDIAYQVREWRKVVELVESHPKLKKKAYILSYYVQALIELGRREKAFAEVEKSLKDRYSDALLSYYIYTLIDLREYRRLKKVIRQFRRYERNIPLPFIYAYLFMQKGRKAYRLYKEAGLNNKVLEAEILYLMGKKEEAKHLKYMEFKRMKELVRKNPKKLKEQEFLRDFLLVAMDFLRESTYERMLMDAKDILPKEVWEDLYLSFLFKANRYGRIQRLARIERHKLQPWMELNLYLYLDDREAVKDILEKESLILPVRDSVEALRRTGSPEKALWLAFAGLEENLWDYKLYKQMRDLVVESEDKFSLETRYLSRKGYTELRTDGKVLIRNLYKGFGLRATFSSMLPLSRQDSILKRAPSGYKVNLSLEKIFKRSHLSLSLGILHRLRGVLSLELSYSTQQIRRTSLDLTFGYGAEAKETLYLYLGGVKDFFRISAVHNVTNRTLLSAELERSKYYSADRKGIGEGMTLTASWSYKLRLSYPDYSFKAYFESSYFSFLGNKGKLVEILPNPKFRVLPESYTSAGVGFYFGYENRDSYTRVWRPFASVSIGYNNRYGSAISLSGGVGGQMWDKDNLFLEGSIGQNISGVKETIIELNVGYNRWF